MVASLYNYKLSDEQMLSIGRIMIAFSHFEYHLNDILAILRGIANPAEPALYPTEHTGRKLREMKKLMNAGVAPQIDYLWQEIRLAMAHALPARNMIAHGILLYGDDGEISFWSQSHVKELALSEVLSLEKWANYAVHAASHAHQHLRPSPFDGEVKLPKPLPERPS